MNLVRSCLPLNAVQIYVAGTSKMNCKSTCIIIRSCKKIFVGFKNDGTAGIDFIILFNEIISKHHIYYFILKT